MNRVLANRIYFAFVFLVFTVKYFFDEYFFDLEHLPLVHYQVSWVFNVFQLVGFTELVTNRSLAIGFHSVFLINCALAFKFKNRIIFPIFSSFLLLTYFIIYNTYNPSQSHPLIFMLVASFSFWTVKEQSFQLLFNGFRYFVVFSIFSAGVWKLLNGGFWYPLEFTTILKHQHVYELTHEATSWYSQFIYWLLAHPIPTELLYRLATILELAFIVGFFTKKYDWILIICFITFFLGDLLFMQLSFYESYIGLICFVKPETVKKLQLNHPNLFNNSFY